MKKKNNKKSISLSIIIQFILSIVIICFLLIWLFGNKTILYYLWLFVGFDLLVMGYNNEKYFHRIGVTLYYIIFGIICVVYSILKIVGVL